MAIDAVLDLLRCPVCGAELQRREATVGCPRGHRFDLARQGHLNLLRSAPPANADTAEMVAARLRFLDAGHYRPILEAVAEYLDPAGGQRWIEPGAGPGWYLSRLLADHPDAVALAGDVSVAAARRAAKAGDRIGAVVFDTWGDWPVADASADLVLVIFAPRHAAEFARVLRPGGRVIVVTPNADHLSALRQRHGLLEVAEAKLDRIAADLGADFDPVGRGEVRADLSLSGAEVADLIAMGPNAFHGAAKNHGAANDHGPAKNHGAATDPAPIETVLSVTVSCWVRREP
ncbi:putative RNA methyltransferase [Enemella sp. A6]|uniref:putative RNA methyltransferase n=1 Tax=Enemella sp. A6 TaxID=3440152 RepID=UPI003EBB64A9